MTHKLAYLPLIDNYADNYISTYIIIWLSIIYILPTIYSTSYLLECHYKINGPLPSLFLWQPGIDLSCKINFGEATEFQAKIARKFLSKLKQNNLLTSVHQLQLVCMSLCYV